MSYYGFCTPTSFDDSILAIPVQKNGGNHTPAFAAAAAGLEAHQATLNVCKALALTGVRVLADEGFHTKVIACERISPVHKY